MVRRDGDVNCLCRICWEVVKVVVAIVETLPVADMSFWDALTNACERTGCKFNVYDGTVEMHE